MFFGNTYAMYGLFYFEHILLSVDGETCIQPNALGIEYTRYGRVK